jgi:integrase
VKLNNRAVDNAKPREKKWKLADGGGLHLLVHPNGGKYWRFKYRVDGKEQEMALGVYPEVSLKQARQRHQAAREMLASGVDPNQDKRDRKLAALDAARTTFGGLAQEWVEVKLSGLTEATIERNTSVLNLHLLPHLGHRPVGEITSPELLSVLRRVEATGAIETPRRAKSIAGQVFRYGIATGRCERDPSADIRDALKPTQSTHYGALVKPDEVGRLMLAIDDYHGSMVVRCALLMSALTFQRPGNVRSMEWDEIEGDEWRIPKEKTKTREPIIVPLSKQAMKVLEEIAPLSGHGRYVFPSARGGSRQLSDGAVRTALRSMGYDRSQMTAHGFRAMARTLLDEALNQRVEWIEMQLGHRVADVHGRAYNRTQFLPERAKMMQRWANYLDTVRKSVGESNVVPMRGRN